MLSEIARMLFDHQHHQLQEILSLSDPALWNTYPIADKWSIHDQIAHLASYQAVFANRLNQILEAGNPSFARYRAADDSAFLTAQSEMDFKLLQSIDTERTTLSHLLVGLSEAQMKQTAVHPLYGKMTLTSWVDFFLLHENHHHFAIFRLQRLMVAP